MSAPARGEVWLADEAVRSVAVERLVVRWGAIDRQTMAAVEDRLRILLRL